MSPLLLLFFLPSLFLSSPFLNEDQVSGFVPINSSGDDIFYWLFRSRGDKNQDPLVFWLTGGPGCSSILAVFTENGPFSVNSDLNLTSNPFSWNNASNIVFVDQPIGTGYSNGKILDYATSELVISQDFYVFIQGFMSNHPEYKQRPIFITGESYAGHYIPAISAFLSEQNNTDINIVGVAIGNGWVDPYVQYPKYADFALENNLISKVHYYLLEGAFKACQALITTGVWLVAMEECQIAVTTILGFPLAPRFNVYDIRKKCDYPPLCYDFSGVENFLKKEEVIEALGVQGRSWQTCNMAVHTALLGDWVTDLSGKVGELLEKNILVLVYSGDKDFICNWRGGEAWTNEVQWHGKNGFNGANYTKWESYGEYKQNENLVFLRVFDAGHMVPLDQPEAALDLLNRFMVTWAKMKMEEKVIE